LGYVCVDEPKVCSLMPPLVKATSPPAYVRFHGATTRQFGGTIKKPMSAITTCTGRAELAEWVPQLRGPWKRKSGTCYVAMNNHYQAKLLSMARCSQELLISTLRLTGTGFSGIHSGKFCAGREGLAVDFEEKFGREGSYL